MTTLDRFVRVGTVVCTMLLPLSASAQLGRTYPPGSHRYFVNGSYEGMQMDPWEAVLRVTDTTVAGVPSIEVRSTTTRHGPDATFTYSTLVRAGTLSAVFADWINEGREPNTCSLSIADGKLSARINSVATEASAAIAGEAVPDFAVGAVLAHKPLADADTIRLTAFRCVPGRDAGPIVTMKFVGVVRSGEAMRNGAATAEPVWLVQGLSSYPMAATISKRDRQLLRFTIPEGSVGEQTHTYANTVPK